MGHPVGLLSPCVHQCINNAPLLLLLCMAKNCFFIASSFLLSVYRLIKLFPWSLGLLGLWQPRENPRLAIKPFRAAFFFHHKHWKVRLFFLHEQKLTKWQLCALHPWTSTCANTCICRPHCCSAGEILRPCPVVLTPKESVSISVPPFCRLESCWLVAAKNPVSTSTESTPVLCQTIDWYCTTGRVLLVCKHRTVSRIDTSSVRLPE